MTFHAKRTIYVRFIMVPSKPLLLGRVQRYVCVDFSNRTCKVVFSCKFRCVRCVEFWCTPCRRGEGKLHPYSLYLCRNLLTNIVAATCLPVVLPSRTLISSGKMSLNAYSGAQIVGGGYWGLVPYRILGLFPPRILGLNYPPPPKILGGISPPP